MQTALLEMEQLDRRLELTDDYDQFRRYVVKLFESKFVDLGVDGNSSDTFMRKLVRSELIPSVCKIELEECLEEAKSKLELWRSNPDVESPFNDKNTRYALYCAAMVDGTDQGDWDFLRERDDLLSRIHLQTEAS